MYWLKIDLYVFFNNCYSLYLSSVSRRELKDFKIIIHGRNSWNYCFLFVAFRSSGILAFLYKAFYNVVPTETDYDLKL